MSLLKPHLLYSPPPSLSRTSTPSIRRSDIMPLIYPSTRIRRGATPIANHTREDGWERYFGARAQAALNDKEATSLHDYGEASGIMPLSDTNGSMESPEKKKLELLDLPLETQKQIFSFVGPMLFGAKRIQNH